jgi:serine protease Do
VDPVNDLEDTIMYNGQDEDKERSLGENSDAINAGRESEGINWNSRHEPRELFRREHTDAGFIPESESQNFRPRYIRYEPEKPKEKTSVQSMGFSRIIALCLICALLGGITGAGVSVMFTMRDSSAVASPQIASPSATPANTPLVSSVGSSGVLSGPEIFEMNSPMVVCINTEITVQSFFGAVPASSSGTGFIIRSDGYIVTNYHVIEGAVQGGYDIQVTLHSGESYTATVSGYEKDNDVAVIKIDAENLPAVTLGDSAEMRVGETVYTIGNPMGVFSYTITSGILSAIDREITTDTNVKINTLQIDAAVNEGNSGGPVLNSRGEVIGIVTAKYNSSGIEGLGFAIPINDAITIMNELIEKGYVSGKPSLDITVTTISRSTAQYYNMAEGSYIIALEEGGAASLAGLVVGDIITHVNDVEVLTVETLRAELKKYAAENTVAVTVVRSGEVLTVDVTLSEVKPETPAESSTQSPSGPQFQRP